MARSKKLKSFKIGDKVYARFFGDKVLLIEDIFTAGVRFPHYICSIEGNKYIVPKIYLSSKTLIGRVESGNHRQLSIKP